MVYKCSVCGYVFDEEAEGRAFSELTECPMCKQPVEKFEKEVSEGKQSRLMSEGEEKALNQDNDLSYPKETRKTDSDYRYMREIHEMQLPENRR